MAKAASHVVVVVPITTVVDIVVLYGTEWKLQISVYIVKE